MIVLTPIYVKENDRRFERRITYLKEAIKSVDLQSAQHIIIDDGSSPSSLESIKDLCQEYGVTFLKRERQAYDLLTCTNALNFGLEHILASDEIDSSECICFLHSDDILIDAKARAEFMKRQNGNFLYSDAVIFVDDSSSGIVWEGLSNPKRNSDFWVYGKMPYPTMTWTKKFLAELKKYVERKYSRTQILNSKVGCGEDVDISLMSLELLKERGENPLYLPQITAGYRIHSTSLSEVRNHKQRMKEQDAILVQHFGRRMLLPLHLRRLMARPEEYFSILLPLALQKRKRVQWKNDETI